MKDVTFKAYEVKEVKDKEYKGKVIGKTISDLPNNDVLIKVKYSSLNYKDALSSIGNKGVTKNYPHTPGIDAAGTVVESNIQSLQNGDKVIVTGYDLGMNTPGGFGEYISVPSNWVVKCPEKLSLKDAMKYGTAGFTAALSVSKIVEKGIVPADGDILVTGGTGGVGSVAISILSKLGYNVIASTGKESQKAFLQSIGAKDIILRDELQASTKRPMLKSRWAGIVDTVGGLSLVNGLKALKYNGCATCCGNVAGHTFESSIYPFILKGITLYGIDSVMCPMHERVSVWKHLASDWNVVDTIQTNEVTLDTLQTELDSMLEGKHVGRTIVVHNN
jgi:alcohol dehydrogenase